MAPETGMVPLVVPRPEVQLARVTGQVPRFHAPWGTAWSSVSLAQGGAVQRRGLEVSARVVTGGFEAEVVGVWRRTAISVCERERTNKK